MSELDDFRRAKDDLFRQADSPLTPEQREHFTGLAYFAENPELRLVVTPELLSDPDLVEIDLSAGDTAKYERWAQVSFEVEGVTATLTVFHDPEAGELFLPFKDTTRLTGETYGAGRYLEPQELEDGTLLLDFNYAYNPYCAYNEEWTCPLTPPENTLSVPIRAGEKTFEDHV